MDKYKYVDITNIELWSDNPRGVDIHNDSLDQSQIIDSFFNTSKKIKEMKNLAEDIALKGLSPTDFICIWNDTKNNKYISLDGNRRVLSLKLLLNPDLMENNKELNRFYRSINTTRLSKEILTYVTEDYKEALEIVERRHLGEDEGRGLKTWQSKEKDFFKSDVKPETTKKISNSYLLRTKYKEKFEDIVERLSSTSVDRIIDYQVVREYFNVKDYSFITEEQADGVLKYLESAEKYQNETEIKLSRFKVKDALKVIESMGKKQILNVESNVETLPKLKLDKHKMIVEQNTTLRIEEIITNRRDFTEIKITPISNKTHYNKTNKILLSTNEPDDYEFKISGFRGNDEIDSTIIKISVIKRKYIPLTAESTKETKTLVSKAGYRINISQTINTIIEEVNSLDFNNYSSIITISLRFILRESIIVLFNTKGWDTNFNNLPDSIMKLKNKLLEQNIQNHIETKIKLDTGTVKNMAKNLDDGRLASFLNHLTHTSTTQISASKVLELSQNEISTLLVYISALLN